MPTSHCESLRSEKLSDGGSKLSCHQWKRGFAERFLGLRDFRRRARQCSDDRVVMVMMLGWAGLMWMAKPAFSLTQKDADTRQPNRMVNCESLALGCRDFMRQTGIWSGIRRGGSSSSSSSSSSRRRRWWLSVQHESFGKRKGYFFLSFKRAAAQRACFFLTHHQPCGAIGHIPVLRWEQGKGPWPVEADGDRPRRREKRGIGLAEASPSRWLGAGASERRCMRRCRAGERWAA